jgi:hypothetical protein
MRRVAQLLVGLLFAGFAGCSLAIDASDLDEGCAPGQKLCGQGNCVSIDDPSYGCRPASCEPCLLENAIPECRDGDCDVRACLDGFGCATPRRGCPAFVLIDELNCGTCNNECGAGESCQLGICVGGETL